MIYSIWLIAVAALVAGCSEPRLEMHLVRSASAPIKSESAEPVACVECITRPWVSHENSSIDLEIESDPYLSVSKARISESEIIHSKWIYRPYCDGFLLSLRLELPNEMTTQAMEAAMGHHTAIVFNGRVVGVGRTVFTGSAIELGYTEKQKAVELAEEIGVSPAFSEADDSWLAELREQKVTTLREIFSDPEELRNLADKVGFEVGSSSVEDVIEREFCP